MIIEEDNFLIKNTEDRIRQAFDNGMLMNTRFLDIRQQSVILQHIKYAKRCNFVLFGGYRDAQRNMLIISPDFYEIKDYDSVYEYFTDNIDMCPISVIRIKKDKFSSELSHRDYLGALMGLGIKRETVGDIIVNDSGCDIVCENKIAAYILENLTSVGRATVSVSLISMNDIADTQDIFETEYHTVASLRLDALVSQCYRLSRTKSVEAITKGLVYVNGVQILKSDFKINEADKIVLRGKGKVILWEIIGESQKGRIKINIKIYK